MTLPSAAVIKIYSVSALPRSNVAQVTQAEFDALKAEVETKQDIEDFYIDITPRYATFDDLSGNWMFVFSHVPAKYAEANLIQVNFQGIRAYRGAWNPTTEYILFSMETAAVALIRNNTERNQSVWTGEVSFFKGAEDLGDERFIVAIDRG